MGKTALLIFLVLISTASSQWGDGWGGPFGMGGGDPYGFGGGGLGPQISPGMGGGFGGGFSPLEIGQSEGKRLTEAASEFVDTDEGI
ncbi:hypothetical protein OSTOST_07391 [Ostertagia ostertagi]